MGSDIDFSELFNDSYEFILRNDELFFDEFYRIFLSASPEVAAVFKNTDMAKQKNMLRDSITYMINFFVTKVADEYLINIGGHHNKHLKVNPRLYELFIDSLLAALKNTYSRYENKCGLAWRITLAPGIEFMKHSS